MRSRSIARPRESSLTRCTANRSRNCKFDSKVLQPRTGRRLRRTRGGRARRSRFRVNHAERPRADPVHIWLDGISKGSLPHPRQPGEQLRSSGPEHGPRPRPGRLLMVTAVPRHGTDGNDLRVDVPGCPPRPDVADALRPGAIPMAEGDQRLQGDHHRRTELLARSLFRCAERQRDRRTWTYPQYSDCIAAPSRSALTRSRGSNRSTAPLGFDLNALTPCYGMAETTLYVAGKRSR